MATYPADPTGDMAPILQASVEAAKMRHPSGKETTMTSPTLTAADRCDVKECPAAAAYRVRKLLAGDLDFCAHHWRKNFPGMVDKGWVTVGGNPDVFGAHS